MMDEYDRFAPAYRRFWGPKSAKDRFPILERKMLSKLPPGARILELCCGTGDLAARLNDAGFLVTGVDHSAGMLRFAKEKAPDTTFLQQDIRKMDLDQKFDAAICFFDSLNHLKSVAELVQVFQRVRDSLHPGAPFLFDLNMDAKYRSIWTGNHEVEDEELRCVVHADAEPEMRKATFDAVVYPKKAKVGSVIRIHLEQSWFEEEEVLSALETAGFQNRRADYQSERGTEQARALFSATA